ncbi:MAG: ACT domain-containing protein [Lachnospiraceae bacterium]|nr:ACT domain-containing protein [Lachnospiraceae bacterium]
MKIKVIKRDFTVCKVSDFSKIDLTDKYCFIGRTEEELSLICSTKHAPAETLERNDGWRGFHILGELDFSLLGVVSEVSTILSNSKISILAEATYNTDYFFVKAENFEKAMEILAEQDYKIIQ